ncbi:uncharacterized protein P884DRAFT_303798 [Thermothelomyces heterothallicus CBS 202.75]|uniref:uncharacterized protein n=1 Tax=Thermothelomyces heterothallicus CBS 202.75 TaxID=1149848 RepID=UPI00374453AA
MTNAFYLALGSKRTADYLYNQESLIPAFVEIERRHDNVADLYKEVIKLLARASVTSDLIDTLPLKPIDWPYAIRLLGGNFDKLKNIPIYGAILANDVGTDIVFTSYTTLFSRNVTVSKVEVPANSIAYTRPELLDRLYHEKLVTDKIDKEGIPLYLRLTSSRGGAGLNSSYERAKVLNRKRRKEGLDSGDDEDSDVVNNPDEEDEDEQPDTPTPTPRVAKGRVLAPKSADELEQVAAELEVDMSTNDALRRGSDKIVTVRLPLNTKIVLPDGTFTYPREEMPPIDIWYVEVKYNKARGDHIANTTTKLLKVLPTISDLFDHANVRKTRRQAKAVPRDKKAGRINIYYYRLLTLGAKGYDYLYKQAKSGTLERMLPTEPNQHAEAMKQVLRFSKQGKFIDQASPGPKMGSAHTEELAEQHPSGGLVWLYSISPETVNTAGLCGLIVVNSPWLQNLVHAILAMASIGVGAIKASYTNNERDNLVHAFNNDNSDIEFLVINMSLSMAGLNLHQDKICRKIVPEILFTGRIPKRIKGRTLCLMVAYEILRMKFAYPFNRFA